MAESFIVGSVINLVLLAMWLGVGALTIYSVAILIVPSLGRVGIRQGMQKIGNFALNKNQERQEQAKANQEVIAERNDVKLAVDQGRMLKDIDLSQHQEVVDENTEISLINQQNVIEQEQLHVLGDLDSRLQALANLYTEIQPRLERLQALIRERKTPRNNREAADIFNQLNLLITRLNLEVTSLKEVLLKLEDRNHGLLDSEIDIYQEIERLDEDHRRKLLNQLSDTQRAINDARKTEVHLRQSNTPEDRVMLQQITSLENEEKNLQAFIQSLTVDDKQIFEVVRKNISELESEKKVVDNILKELNKAINTIYGEVQNGTYGTILSHLSPSMSYATSHIRDLQSRLRARHESLRRIWQILQKIRESQTRMHQISQLVVQLRNRIQSSEQQKLSNLQSMGLRKIQNNNFI